MPTSRRPPLRTPDGRYLVVRGPVWWTDGAVDENRKRVQNSSYAAWWAGLDASERT